MPNPKRRHSKARRNKRRAHDALRAPQTTLCPNCQDPRLPHRVCPKCGYYKGRAKREDSQVRLHGTVTARAEVACDRCLRPVVVPIETEFDATYIPAALDTTGAGEAAELQADEMDVDIYEGNEIDIDRLVR